MKKIFIVFIIAMVAVSSGYAFTGWAAAFASNGTSDYDYQSYSINSKVINIRMELLDDGSYASIIAWATNGESVSFTKSGINNALILPSTKFSFNYPYNYIELYARAISDDPSEPDAFPNTIAWVYTFY